MHHNIKPKVKQRMLVGSLLKRCLLLVLLPCVSRGETTDSVRLTPRPSAVAGISTVALDLGGTWRCCLNPAEDFWKGNETMPSRCESFPDMYNVVWDSQSEDASASMPVGGGDIGCNVWVEDNQLLVYMQRSGIHDEFNGFPKLGRVRFWTEPNIFDGAISFRQELKLKDGSIEIDAVHKKYGDVKIKIWVEVHRPVIHIETHSGKDLKYFTQYESWRTQPRPLDPKSVLGERWGWWDVEGWKHEAILEPDQFQPEENGMAFYHVNPDDKLTSKQAYENMGLGEYYGQYPDPLKDLVWGGWINGTDWSFEGKYEEKYQSTNYTGWRYQTKKPSKRNKVSIVLHTSV